MHHLHAEVSTAHAFGKLRAAQRAAIEILPFQLEPALALIGGHASRCLLADEVGLGKTIQAGLILSELLLRGWCERALIVTPAGLRQQWADELLNRFEIRAAIIDAPSLSARAESLPFDVNPWSVEPVAITSIDFLKQPEVLQGLLSQQWDALIVDEAHQATIASLRYDAVNALATRARHVLLLTATPHAGDERAYRALCAIGRTDGNDPILLFRRTRRMAGPHRARRAHLLPVTPTDAGREMHRLLASYLAQLWCVAHRSGNRDVQLVAMVLAKRAFSSARSLATSLEKRLASLAGRIDLHTQVALPLGFDDDATDDPVLPGARAFESADDERALLRQLIDAATAAQTGERKMRVLRRIVRRVREPLIIFTEYRDTLDAIAAALGTTRSISILHGGLTPHDRRQSVQAFNTGAADIMLATDAGSEGLNLHDTCRLVVNLELPWNPIRLEQRIGRVDRIGQTRTVHAINLFSDGTAERIVLANLLRRIDRIRLSEIEIASCVIHETEPPPRLVTVDSVTDAVNLEVEARAEADRISRARRLQRRRSDLSEQVVPVTIRRSTNAALISFFRIRLVTAAGRLVEDSVVPVRIAIDDPHIRFTRRAARAFADSLSNRFGSRLSRCVSRYAEKRARAISIEFRDSLARAVRRERTIASRIGAASTQLVQAGLFDTKALKDKWTADRRRLRLVEESDARAALLESDSRVRLAEDPELVMLLIQCSRG
jgi:superfamily II DNA or RNA helicase